MNTEEHRRLRNVTDSHERSASVEEEEYVKRYDAYRPKFQGIPEGYYPNTWGNVILIWSLLGLLYIIAAGLFALFLKLLFIDTTAVSWVYAGVGGIYVLLVVFLIFVGGTMKSRLEKKYMEEALAKQNEQNRKANPTAI